MTERALNGREPASGVRRPERVRASGSEVVAGAGRRSLSEGSFVALTAFVNLPSWGGVATHGLSNPEYYILHTDVERL